MPATRSRPHPPRPELVRRPDGAFGWLDAHLLHDGWLARAGPDGAAVLVLLALAADRHGASYYGRVRMAESLSLTIPRVDAALGRLRELGLLTHRPWRPGGADGVWQLLPVPRRDRPKEHAQPDDTPARGGAPVHIAAILAQLGITPDRQNQADSRRR